MRHEPEPDRIEDRDRRFVLRALAALLPAVACAGPAVVQRRELSGALVAGEVPSSVVTLGRAYLERFPDEADRERLAGALGLHDEREPEPDRIARINAAIRDEIDADDLVDLAGWQLARTECRLCALAALAA